MNYNTQKMQRTLLAKFVRKFVDANPVWTVMCACVVFISNLKLLNMVVQNVLIVTNHLLPLGVPESISKIGIWLTKMAINSFANCAMKNLKFNIP